MSRPKEKLIDRQSIVLAAINRLEISGMDGFNLRQLGKDLNVNPASIYHYFDGKEDILRAVAAKILHEAVVPDPAADWPNWFAQGALGYYRVLLDKPFLIPIMLAGFRPRMEVAKRNAELLAGLGVPEPLRPDVVRAIEGCVIGLAQMAIFDRAIETGSRMKLDREKILTQTVLFLLTQMIEQARQLGELEVAAV